MAKIVVYDKYSSNIDITFKKQNIEQTGKTQTVLVLEVLKEKGQRKEVILGDLSGLASFKDGTLSHDIRDLLREGRLVNDINFSIELDDTKKIDECLAEIYDGLKDRNFHFTKEGYRLLNAESKDRLDVVTEDDITANFTDERTKPKEASKYEYFKPATVYEEAEKSRPDLKMELGNQVNDDKTISENYALRSDMRQSLSLKKGISKGMMDDIRTLVFKIKENPEIVNESPYDSKYKAMLSIVEWKCRVDGKPLPKDVDEVVDCFYRIYKDVRENKSDRVASDVNRRDSI